jgi:hypothetical protein
MNKREKRRTTTFMQISRVVHHNFLILISDMTCEMARETVFENKIGPDQNNLKLSSPRKKP